MFPTDNERLGFNLNTLWEGLGASVRRTFPQMPTASDAGYYSDVEFGQVLAQYDNLGRVVELAESTLPLAVHASDAPVTLTVNNLTWYLPSADSAREYALLQFVLDTIEDGLQSVGLSVKSMEERKQQAYEQSLQHIRIPYSRRSGISSLPVQGKLTVSSNHIRLLGSLTIDAVCDPDFPELTSALFPPRLLGENGHAISHAMYLRPSMTPLARLPADLSNVHVHTLDRYGGHWTIDCNGLLPSRATISKSG